MDDNRMNPYGFHIPSGYVGRLPNGHWMEFETDVEYRGYLEEWRNAA